MREVRANVTVAPTPGSTLKARSRLAPRRGSFCFALGRAEVGRVPYVSAWRDDEHCDDDLLFLSPDLLHHVRSGKCVRTVFLTAGDAAERVGGTTGQMRQYWMDREAGSRAAYALMAGVRT